MPDEGSDLYLLAVLGGLQGVRTDDEQPGETAVVAADDRWVACALWAVGRKGVLASGAQVGGTRTYSWPEYGTNHRVDHPASYYWPGKPADWILAAKDRAHGSMIKRPTLVKGQKPGMTINYRVTESPMLTVSGLPGLEIGGGGQSREGKPRRPSVQPVVV